MCAMIVRSAEKLRRRLCSSTHRIALAFIPSSISPVIAQFTPPSINLPGNDIPLPRHLANRSARRKGFPNNRSLLLQAPPSPPLGARQHLNSAHRTVSCTSASDSACTVPTQTR
jgi:hypothetical protein